MFNDFFRIIIISYSNPNDVCKWFILDRNTNVKY